MGGNWAPQSHHGSCRLQSILSLTPAGRRAVCSSVHADQLVREKGPDRMAEALCRNLISQLLVQPRRLSLFHSIGGDRKGWHELSDMTGAVVMFYQLFVSVFTAKTETAGEL